MQSPFAAPEAAEGHTVIEINVTQKLGEALRSVPPFFAAANVALAQKSPPRKWGGESYRS